MNLVGGQVEPRSRDRIIFLRFHTDKPHVFADRRQVRIRYRNLVPGVSRPIAYERGGQHVVKKLRAFNHRGIDRIFPLPVVDIDLELGLSTDIREPDSDRLFGNRDSPRLGTVCFQVKIDQRIDDRGFDRRPPVRIDRIAQHEWTGR